MLEKRSFNKIRRTLNVVEDLMRMLMSSNVTKAVNIIISKQKTNTSRTESHYQASYFIYGSETWTFRKSEEELLRVWDFKKGLWSSL